MAKIKITKEMLEGEGGKILGTEITTDEQINYYGWGNPKKPLKIIAVKGYINDWTLYIGSMDREMGYGEVKDYGNKIIGREIIKLLVDCDDYVLSRYRD